MQNPDRPPRPPEKPSEYDGHDDYRKQFEAPPPLLAAQYWLLMPMALFGWFASSVFVYKLLEPKGPETMTIVLAGLFSYCIAGPTITAIYCWVAARSLGKVLFFAYAAAAIVAGIRMYTRW